jgi:cell fate (sporulation/competence/biofilm development) regulator YlbF (YheA/YmcA/DUF963 family)
MPVDTQQIMDEAEKLGRLVAQHPAIDSYRKAQRAIAEDPDASRSLAEFDRQLENLARQEQTGMGITDAQRQQLESLQSRIVSNIKVKALNMAQVEFMDLLRKVTQTIQRPLTDAAAGYAGGPGGGGNGGGGSGGRAAAAPPKIV